MKSKEAKYLIFMVASIVMGLLMCVTSVKSGSLSGTIISTILLGMLCVALGYLYCKYEDKIFVGKAVGEKKEEKPKPNIFKSKPSVDVGKVLGEKESKPATNDVKTI